MGLRQRKPLLPDGLVGAWTAFLDCAQVIEGGRRTLLGTMPVGRVEPTPVGLGVDAMAAALDDADTWMPRWRTDALQADWEDCVAAIEESRAGLDEVRTVAASTRELEELQGAVMDVVAPLDAFADAERAWRRAWRIPRELA